VYNETSNLSLEEHVYVRLSYELERERGHPEA